VVVAIALPVSRERGIDLASHISPDVVQTVRRARRNVECFEIRVDDGPNSHLMHSGLMMVTPTPGNGPGVYQRVRIFGAGREPLDYGIPHGVLNMPVFLSEWARRANRAERPIPWVAGDATPLQPAPIPPKGALQRVLDGETEFDVATAPRRREQSAHSPLRKQR
jgi:hypothetical protein